MTAAIAPTAHEIRVGRRTIAVIGPTTRDPRMWIAIVITSLQVLGQTLLHFDVSIAQILVSIGTCALIELVVTARRTHAIVWPASAMLTGNGIALLLRIPGTAHGDWWSLQGAWIYAATGAVALASKYVIRVRGAHIFNPSNFGLLVCFLVLGPKRVEPLDFWWGPVSFGLALALTVIVVGAAVILSRIRMLRVAIAFLVPFAAVLGLVAVFGHCMTARWHVGALCGASFWWILATSPEILVYCCFMITDPKTAPRGEVSRFVYAVSIGVVAALLVAPQRTEYASKVAVLGALAFVCALQPFVERLFPAAGSAEDRLGAWFPGAALRRRRSRGRLVVAAIAGVALVGGAAYGAGVPARSGRVVLSDRVASGGGRPGLVRTPHVPSVRVVHDRMSSQIDAKTARAIAHDVAEDLVIQQEALRRRAAPLAIEAADRAWVERLLHEISSHRTSSITVPEYEAERMVISVGLRPGQAAPAVLVTMRVRARDVTYDSGGHQTDATAMRSAVLTWEAWWSGEHYLLVSNVVPPRWHRPAI